MDILYWLFVILCAYFIVVFFILRIVVPFMGFGRWQKPKEIPEAIKNKIAELESQSSGAEDYLKRVYDFVVLRWHAGRMNTVLFPHLAFRTNLEKIWDTPGYAHCNTQNYLVFVLLTGSKFFTAQDIKPKCVFFNMFIHQYLEVKVGDKVLDIDPAGASIHGKPFGQHISFFG